MISRAQELLRDALALPADERADVAADLLDDLGLGCLATGDGGENSDAQNGARHP